MSSQLTEEQARQLADLAASLKGTTIEEFVKSQLKIKTEEEQRSSKTADEDLTKSTTPLAGIKALLALHADTTISKSLPQQSSVIIPNFQKMFYVLNSMDYHISNNFQARRGIPSLDPTLSRLYISILCIVAILRVQQHARLIAPEDLAFIRDFFELYPPEDLPIPGPLMLFFKSLCVSFPENPDFQRVLPALPKRYPQLPTSSTNPALIAKDLRFRFTDMNHIDWFIPFPPYIAYMHHQMHRSTFTEFEKGVNDSASNGMATLTQKADGDFKTPIDYLLSPTRSKRNEYFPFTISKDTNTNAVTNATTDFTQYRRTDVFGNSLSGSLPNATATTRACFSKVGISEPIRINPDLVPQIKKSHLLLSVPDHSDEVDSKTYATIASALLMDEDMEWFARLVAHMSAYSKFFHESGTLADCSLEGPRVLQHIATIQTPSTPVPEATYLGEERRLLRFPLSLSTSLRETNRLVEMTAAYTCLNIAGTNYFSYLADLGTGVRTGPFWTISPVYDNGTTDKAYIKVDNAIQKQLISRPKDMEI